MVVALHGLRAWTLGELGQLDAAFAAVELALDVAGFDALANRHDPAWASLLNTKGEICRRAGRFDDARALFKLALECHLSAGPLEDLERGPHPRQRPTYRPDGEC